MTTIDVLDRFWQPVSEVLTPEVAQTIVSFTPDDEVTQRVAELGEKADSGTLTDEERAEYKYYINAGDMISLLKAKARRYLASQTG